MPRASIVIPSFNQAEFIEETIQSALVQERVSMEVIVIDGGSSDGTLEILHRYENHVIWESRSDSGVHEAVNRGFSLAQGEFIGWLNSDDVYYRTDTLRRVSDEFARRPEVDILYGDVAVIGTDSRLLRFRYVPAYDRERLERSNAISQPAVFMRRRVVERERLRPFLSLDYEYWIRLGRKGYRFRHLPMILAGDRQYPSRISVRNWDQIVAEARSYKREHGISASVHPFRRTLDRIGLAPMRLKGCLQVVKLLLDRTDQRGLAFPMKIDSPLRLLGRQMFRSIVDVGLEMDPNRTPESGSIRAES